MLDKPAIFGGEPVAKKPIKFTEIIIGDEEKRAIMEILETKQFVSGDYITKFEKEFAAFVGAKYAISISNGTDALFLAYLALGITFGNYVITTPLTFVATASSIIHAGAIPLFADVEDDGNLSPKSIEKVMDTYSANAITVVHMYGKPAKMDEILEIARERNSYVIEDAAHAHGAEYKGRKVGTLGDIATFSLYPTKILAAGGWGGVITTNRKEIADSLILLRAHGELRHVLGREGEYLYAKLGYNMRMSNIEAAVAYYQLRKIDRFIEQRRKIARLLNDALEDIPGINPPTEEPYIRHVYYIYSITIDEKEIGWPRDDFVRALNAEGIEARTGYHVPLHKQELFIKINDPTINHFARVNKYPEYSKQTFPQAEKLAKYTIWLPMHPNLTEEDVEKISYAITKLIKWRRKNKTF